MDTLRYILPNSRDKENSGLPILTPRDDGVDFTSQERAQFLRIVMANRATRKKGDFYVRRRVRGANDERIGKKAVSSGHLYKECVSGDCTERSRLEAAPSTFTIFGAELPQELLTRRRN